MTDSPQPAASLTISHGPGAGREFGIGAAPVTIGRHDQCDFQVENTWVSRRHARIAWNGTEYVVEDLGSTNGTFVNGERISGPRALRSGDLVQLGDEVQLAFRVRAPAAWHEEPVRVVAGQPRAEPLPVQKGPFLRRKSTRVWGLALLGILLVFLIGGGTYYLLSDREQAADGTPGVQAALPQVTTAAPTVSPIPATATATATPVPSTATPSATPTPAPTRTPKPAPLVIKGEAFEADYEGTCSTDVAITEVVGDALRIEVLSGTISIREGGLTIWCYGAKHTWIGTLTYGGYTFISDEESPLQFILDRSKGYSYLSGKGTVVKPDGTSVELPQ
jgi:pSer/pThr/pTyr-binding forkhead associated (FHA) protein